MNYYRFLRTLDNVNVMHSRLKMSEKIYMSYSNIYNDKFIDQLDTITYETTIESSDQCTSISKSSLL
jgi:hypothetical protein